jgi:hypothetical protein
MTSTLRIIVCVAIAVACAAQPRTFAAPTVDLPAGVEALGTPCSRQTTGYVCGAAHRVSSVRLTDYEAITGRDGSDGDDPLAPSRHVTPVMFPTRILGVITLARDWSRPGGHQHVNEITVFADGPRLWIRAVHEYAEQFPTASLTILDRRWLEADHAGRILDALDLPRNVDLDDDDALRRALSAMPNSLGPHLYGELGEWLTITHIASGSGREAKKGDLATLRITGMLANGTVFETTAVRAHQLGAGVVSGVVEGVLGMRPGGKRRVTIPPRLAGGVPKAPKGSWLIFDIELLALQ